MACGALAQLGERLNGIQEVNGSNPLCSTIIIHFAGVTQLVESLVANEIVAGSSPVSRSTQAARISTGGLFIKSESQKSKA